MSRFKALAESRSCPKGFSITTRRQASIFLVGQPGLAQLLHDLGKELRRRGQIEQIVGLRAVLPVDGGELCGQSRIRGGIARIHRADSRAAAVNHFQVFRASVLGVQEAGDLVAKLLAAQIVEGHAHHGKILWQQFGFYQVIERGNQLAFGQVARGPEEHHHARTGSLANLFVLLLPIHCRCRRHVLLVVLDSRGVLLS